MTATSFVSVEEVKVALVFDLDDARIQMAIDDAEDEALLYLNFPGEGLASAIAEQEATSDTWTPQGGEAGNYNSIRRAVILLVRCYVDDVKPDEVDRIRKQAREIMFPYRKFLGV